MSCGCLRISFANSPTSSTNHVKVSGTPALGIARVIYIFDLFLKRLDCHFLIFLAVWLSGLGEKSEQKLNS